MKRLHVVGRKNHGKTTLVVELVREMTARGLKVGAIKHTGHAHELDRPGSDSHQLREAGAVPSTIVSGPLAAIFLPLGGTRGEESSLPLEGADYVAAVSPLYAGCDLVLVEGNRQRPGPKVEVWRREVGTEPIAGEDDSVVAVVSDDAPDVAVPVLPRGDVAAIADAVLDILGLRTADLGEVEAS